MRAVVTRVKNARVEIDGKVNGKTDGGFLVLLGVAVEDTEKECDHLADKVCSLLVISQFTLFADCKSRRPGFTGAARPDTAIPLYERFMAQCEQRGFHVEHGEFGADMQVFSQNDGPVTILLDTDAV